MFLCNIRGGFAIRFIGVSWGICQVINPVFVDFSPAWEMV
jgi:hypothetical protein